MSGQSRSVINAPSRFLIILAVSLALNGLLCVIGVIPYLDRLLYDLCVNSRVQNKDNEKNQLVSAVYLDDKSIQLAGKDLDSRMAFAEVISVLDEINAAAVMDFQFRYAKSTSDLAFADAVDFAGNTVTAVLAVEDAAQALASEPLSETERLLLRRHIWDIKVINEGKIPKAENLLLPFPALLEAAAQIGHINAEPDEDGVYRRVPLLYAWDGGFIPSLPLAAVVKNNKRIKIDKIELKAGEYLSLPLSEKEAIRIPIDERGCMLVPFTEIWKNNIDGIPFHKVLTAKQSKSFEEINHLTNHFVLIAETSTSQKDFGPTSFEKLYPLSGLHAEVMRGILNAFNGYKLAFISWPSRQYKFLVVLLLLSAAILSFLVRRDTLFHSGFLLSLIIFASVTFYRWQNYAISPWFAFPSALLFFLWLSAFLNRLLLRYRETLLMQTALSRYFPRALSERIMRERKTELIPAYKELTILFSDISGFTKWSSDKSAEQVHNFLSDYLESMAEILFAHGGTVDKFMGDGILAFFGDPFDMPNHTELCVEAAIAMQKKVRVLAEKWKPIVDIDLKVRVGVNTGKVIVGNLGNKTRIEYTVIGAAVNLAQRMESNAPVGGILITADAWEKVKDKFAFSEKRDVTVKGYGETIGAYVVSF